LFINTHQAARTTRGFTMKCQWFLPDSATHPVSARGALSCRSHAVLISSDELSLEHRHREAEGEQLELPWD
jgi:hypothetical protein